MDAGSRDSHTAAPHSCPLTETFVLACRALLASIVCVVVACPAFAGSTQGWNFMPVFVEDIFAMTWRGQFNVDFTCLLLLSGLWLAWRHRRSSVGIVLG